MRKNNSDNQSGFTILEVMIAIVILTIGILSVNVMQLSSIRGNHTANILTSETGWTSSIIEWILNSPYHTDSNGLDNADSNGSDDDGDGVIDETDESYIDDGFGTNNGLAGLDDGRLNGNTPDGSLLSMDGNYTIYWNVAVNYPQPGMKTIRAFVRNNNGAVKTVSFTDCKINF